MTWVVSGKKPLQRAYHKKISLLSKIPEGKTQSIILNQSGESEIAECRERTFDPFRSNLNLIFRIPHLTVSQWTWI